MLTNTKLSTYDKSLIEKFKNSKDPDIHFECGLNSLNELLWANLIEYDIKTPLKIKEFRKFFDKKLIRGSDNDSIKWLEPHEKFKKTEKIYKCVVVELYLNSDIYDKLMAS